MYTRLLLLFSASLLLAGCDVEVFVTGSGVVTASDPAIAQCDSAPACYSVARGASITLQAEPRDGFVFAGWGGACEAAVGTRCTLSVSANRRVQATFLPASGEQAEALMQPGSEYYFAAPWPNDAYSRREDGTLDAERMPLPEKGIWGDQLRRMAARTRGFGTHAGVYFQIAFSNYVWEYLEDGGASGYFDENAGYFLNVDPASARYGDIIPGQLTPHISDEDVGQGIRPPLETRGVVMLEPKAGYSLEAATTYAAILSASDGVTPSALLAKLDQPYEKRLGFSPAIFDQLRTQKRSIEAALVSVDANANRYADISAFTVFTTQDPKAADHAVKAALAQISDADILARSYVSDGNGESCNANGYRNITVTTRAPNFMTGKQLYLWGGGDIVTRNGVALVQGENELQLQVYAPCAPGDAPIPLIVHANYTGSWGTDTDFEMRNAISVFLTAPAAGERLPTNIADILAFLRRLDIYAGEYVDYLVDFNFFNLEAAKNQHIQYGAELAYSLRVAKLLPSIVSNTSGISPRQYVYDPNTVTLSGWSLGGVVTLHALAQGADADVVTVIRAPRPSALHFDSLSEYLDLRQPGLSDKILGYVGVRAGYPTQPALQLLQTVLEPMDTLNYLDELTARKFVWVFSEYDDKLHGGDAAYSMASAMSRRLNAQPVSLVDSGSRVDWLSWGVESTPLTGDELDGLQRKSLQLMLSQNEEYYESINLARCFPYALTKPEVNLAYAVGSVTMSDYIDCASGAAQ